MKDSVLNLLVFLLVFVAAAAFFLAMYGLVMGLVPGGRGLVFASPYAASLLPALLVALLVALYRAHRRPGAFTLTWVFLALAFEALLALSLPIIEGLPPVRAADASPLVPGRFLPLDDGSLLLSDGKASIVVPSGSDNLRVTERTEYDPLNRRFVFSSGEPAALGSSGPEKLYYQYTPALMALQTDFLAIYRTLQTSWQGDALLFWAQTAAITWLFLGLYLAFALRTWPLVHLVLMLVLVRVALWLTVYSFRGVPAVAALWIPGPAGDQWGPWLGLLLMATAAATLFFMTWLAKPHRERGL